MKIHVVMGSTGEYSDRDEWPVAAFRDEKQAEARVLDATRRAKEIEVTRSSRYSVPPGENEYDPDMRMDYTGTSYFIYTVELI